MTPPKRKPPYKQRDREAGELVRNTRKHRGKIESLTAIAPKDYKQRRLGKEGKREAYKGITPGGGNQGGEDPAKERGDDEVEGVLGSHERVLLQI